MFKWKVKEVAQEKGIASAIQLADLADVAPGTATALWYGRPTRIDLPTLNRVCKALKCAPWDVLVYTPEDKRNPVSASA